MDNALPLLLVPGMMCSPRLFDAQVEAFSPTREVIIADNVSADSMAGFAMTILDSAPETFALLGLSMGGYIAFEIMRRAPERVDRLALLNSRAALDEPGELEGRRALLATADANGVEAAVRVLLPRLLHLSRMDEEPLVDIVATMAREVGREAFHRQMNAVINRPDNVPILKKIACPTVVIVGDTDALTQPHHARAIAAQIPDAQLHVIPECGHLSTLERPREVNAILRGWLEA